MLGASALPSAPPRPDRLPIRLEAHSRGVPERNLKSILVAVLVAVACLKTPSFAVVSLPVHRPSDKQKARYLRAFLWGE